jgi:hypothetical protein
MLIAVCESRLNIYREKNYCLEQIGRDEWMLFLVNRKLSAKEERLRDAFRKFAAAEASPVLGAESDAVAHALLLEVDRNGDGAIDYDEFLAMWSERAAK